MIPIPQKLGDDCPEHWEVESHDLLVFACETDPLWTFHGSVGQLHGIRPQQAENLRENSLINKKVSRPSRPPAPSGRYWFGLWIINPGSDSEPEPEPDAGVDEKAKDADGRPVILAVGSRIPETDRD